MNYKHTLKKRKQLLNRSGIIDIQADPYSVRFFTNVNTAQKIYNSRIGTKSGGRKSRKIRKFK
jgi:hypothetical protein